ncbi:ABC transporter ATP-binding protein, partial [uncultured Varibaculum sp.]
MSTAVSINSVSMRYGKKQALREVSLNIPEASIFALIGPSGCGKTTLVKILMGLLKPVAGSVNIFGEGAPNGVSARQTGYMAQAAALYPLLTGRENLEFFGKLYGLRGLELKERIGAMAQLVRLNEDLDTQTQNYSGGMLQRLSLAVALLHNPRLLVLDEPTVGIDPLLRSEIWKELRSLATAG